MIYLIPDGDTFTIIYNANILSEEQLSQAIKVDSLPEGEGILKMNKHGELYYEPLTDTPKPTIDDIAEENLLETKYQTLLLEMML